MRIQSIEINGYRGFETPQTLRLAQPDGRSGSGITTIVGPNNAGKSSILEAISYLVQPEPPSFSMGRRNQGSEYRISIKATTDEGGHYSLHTVPSGGSETFWTAGAIPSDVIKTYVLPSRRYFDPFFGRGIIHRFHYLNASAPPSIRGAALNRFTDRLFEIQKNKEAFDRVLAKVLSPLPDWTIELAESGQHYLKFVTGNSSHSSDGLGEGIVSLFFIVDSLYDSEPNELIVIDEPELSLHPSLQKKLYQLFQEFAKDRQILISTHSPYFVDFESIVNGAKISRVHRIDGVSVISPLSDESVAAISRQLNDLNNPHVFGLDMRETFFVDDGVILVEGQEDVVFFKGILKGLNIELRDEFLGWGVGGAEKMKAMAKILADLGFQKVAGILDGNRCGLAENLNREFPEYSFFVIPAEDVRTKRARDAQPEVQGLVEHGQLREEYKEGVTQMFQDIQEFFNRAPEVAELAVSLSSTHRDNQ